MRRKVEHAYLDDEICEDGTGHSHFVCFRPHHACRLVKLDRAGLSAIADQVLTSSHGCKGPQRPHWSDECNHWFET
jgi:hypothetical protein